MSTEHADSQSARCLCNAGGEPEATDEATGGAVVATGGRATDEDEAAAITLV